MAFGHKQSEARMCMAHGMVNLLVDWEGLRAGSPRHANEAMDERRFGDKRCIFIA